MRAWRTPKHLVSFHKFLLKHDRQAKGGFSIDFEEMQRTAEEQMRDDATEAAIRAEEAAAEAEANAKEL